MYKELEEKNKNNKDDNIHLEFNYPYYIYKEIKKKEIEEKKIATQQNQDEEKKEKKHNEKYNNNIQLEKSNIKYNILYEY